MNINIWKEVICAVLGGLGGLIATIFGGWDAGMTTLITFIAIDFTTGLMVAAFFKKSNKSPSGALNSKSCFRGICKKMMILIFVYIGFRIDIALNVDYFKNAITIGCIANELISILENAGLMGVKLPKALIRAIDLLKHKEDAQE